MACLNSQVTNTTWLNTDTGCAWGVASRPWYPFCQIITNALHDFEWTSLPLSLVNHTLHSPIHLTTIYWAPTMCYALPRKKKMKTCLHLEPGRAKKKNQGRVEWQVLFYFKWSGKASEKVTFEQRPKTSKRVVWLDEVGMFQKETQRKRLWGWSGLGVQKQLESCMAGVDGKSEMGRGIERRFTGVVGLCEGLWILL